MPDVLDPELAVLLTELVEKIGLLRRDMQQKGDLDKYEARIARIEQKFSALAERISRADPDLAKALRTAWQLPARSLAFRNADHQKELKGKTDDTPGTHFAGLRRIQTPRTEDRDRGSGSGIRDRDPGSGTGIRDRVGRSGSRFVVARDERPPQAVQDLSELRPTSDRFGLPVAVNFNRCASSTWVSTSARLPIAITTKCTYAFVPCWCPSATLDGIATAARRSCDVRP